MAIIDVKRVTVVGHDDNKEEIVKSLQGLGALEIAPNTFEGVDQVDSTNSIIDLETKLSDVKFALDLLKPFDESKSSMFSVRPEVDLKEIDEFEKLERKQLLAVESLKEYASELAWAKSNINHSKNVIMQVEPYKSFDETFDALGEHFKTYATLGLVNLEQKSEFIKKMDSFEDSIYYEVLDELKEAFVVFAVVHIDRLSEFKNSVKTFGFTEVKYQNYEDSPINIINTEKDEILAYEAKINQVNAEIYGYTENIKNLQSLEDYYSAKLKRENASLDFGYTKNAFVLEGWINANRTQEVEKVLTDISDDILVSFRDPNEDEEYPTIIKNNKLSTPFEAITEMYDTPSAKGIDPNMFMAPFYFIFFGMMMSDAGYGLILALACSFILFKTKPTGMMGKILGVVALCGVSTLLWGIVFGGWFGINVEPLWFNPLQEPMMMLGLCLGIGFFQVIVGLLIAAGVNIKRGKPLDALFDQFSWIILLIGLPMLILGGTFATVGTYLSIAGAGLLLLFAGRANKGIAGKAVGGLSSLYGITGYLSDILSYSRIFGMGLATGVIAMVFNTIGSMLMNKWYGIPFAIVVLLVGHVFNIGINTLGAYVHSCRLQYIEFYGKFFEGGGRAFRPLTMELKHYRYKQD